MQQITFENWKQLGLKVGDPILIKYPKGYELETTIDCIDTYDNFQPIRFSDEYGSEDWLWIDFDEGYKFYYKVNSQEGTSPHINRYDIRALFADTLMFCGPDLRGYFYHAESNTIETHNVTPHKILKHSTNQNGERVWKLRGTWITDTQIKNAINPPKQMPVQNAQYMIAAIINNCVSILDQTIYTDVESLKQEMQNLALSNPHNKYVAVQMTDIKVSLDFSNPVFKWD